MPHKNIALLDGKPLVSYCIQAALQSGISSEVIVSTDDQAIADIAMAHGAHVPALRPAHLSGDDSEMMDVLVYELIQYEARMQATIDGMILLQPTSPLTEACDIIAAVNIFEAQQADAVISVVDSKAHPYKSQLIQEGAYYRLICDATPNITNRQALPPVYMENGSIFVLSRTCIMDAHTIHPEKLCIYDMPKERSIDIDDAFDLEIAEFMLKRN